MHRLAVFCGSSKGHDPDIEKMAINLGHLLGENKISLVYGGASIGIMAAVANAVLEKGVDVHGVIPKKLQEFEVSHTGLTSLEVTNCMHTRKARLYDLSDGFVALPGGFGTMDEIFEILTWAQLGYHSKPVYILNYKGFYDVLIKHIDHMVQTGFVSQKHKSLVNICTTPEELVESFLNRK